MRDIAAAELDKVLTMPELESLPRGETYLNPFAVLIMAGNKRADKLGRQWAELHDGYHDGRPPKVDTSDDPLAKILADAALKRAGIRVLKHPDSGEVVAVFPDRQVNPTRQDECAWEARAKAMHDAQMTINVADLPERTMDKPENFNRPTFHSTMTESESPKFEDLSPEERHQLMRRGG